MGIIHKHQRGAILVTFALLLIVLLGFVALAVDVGYWYMVRAELSKSVDAGSLAGAKNISNPHVDCLELAKEFGRENFPAGYTGTPNGGTGTIAFNADYYPDAHSVRVNGSVSAPAFLAQLFGMNRVDLTNLGVSKKNKVEIMLVLDRSGSMAGTKISDLKRAAGGDTNTPGFIDFFKDTQDEDKLGLVSFATTVRVDFPLGINFYTPMQTAISGMTAVGATNAEDALAQAGGQLTDQSGVPGSDRVQQYVIFFSDGMPTALRDRFKYNGTDYDGVVYGEGTSAHANCLTTDYSYMNVHGELQRPNAGTFYPGVNPDTTGDGKSTSTTSCGHNPNTKWYLFEAGSLGPVPGYGAESCSIPMNKLLPYFCNAARTLAQKNAQTLKDRYVKIYVIGLGSNANIDATYACGLSSGSGFCFITPTSSDLQAIFNAIAKDIKLRLVQ